MKQVGVIGAGSWGTALSLVLAENGCEVSLFTRRQEIAAEMKQSGVNSRYLPHVHLPQTVVPTTDLAQAVKGKEALLLVVPSHAVKQICLEIKEWTHVPQLLIHAVKGLETESGSRMSQVIAQCLNRRAERDIVVLSGPSHAEEVGQKLPTTVVVASRQLELAEQAQDLLMNAFFRVYTNLDVIGVEIGGSLKNIIAIAAGISDGLGFGDNAKAALITRGLAEITRLGVSLGASSSTFSGLAGIGDLVVTCNSRHSRNWRTGYRLGQGISLSQVLSEMGMVVEGVRTTQVAYTLSTRLGVSMPITHQLYQVLFEGLGAKEAVERLMGRLKRHEMESLD